MEEEKANRLGNILNGATGPEGGSLFSCIRRETEPAMEPVKAPAPPPPPPAVPVPQPALEAAEAGWRLAVQERLARAEAVEKELRAVISDLRAGLDQAARAPAAGAREVQALEGRLKADIARLRAELQEPPAGGPAAASGDLEAVRLELAKVAGRSDALARTLAELARRSPKAEPPGGGYAELLPVLRKVYEVDARQSCLVGRLDKIEEAAAAAAAARGKDQDRFSRLEVKAVELEGRADHLSALFGYFRDLLEKFIGAGVKPPR